MSIAPIILAVVYNDFGDLYIKELCNDLKITCREPLHWNANYADEHFMAGFLVFAAEAFWNNPGGCTFPPNIFSLFHLRKKKKHRDTK